MALTDYTWYNVFNKTEFEALGLVSKSYTYNLEGIGETTILATLGNELSVLFGGVVLPLNLNSKNPFEFDGKAIYLDSDNDVYIGVPNDS